MVWAPGQRTRLEGVGLGGYRVSAGFTGAHSDSLIDIENEDFAIPNFAGFG